MDANELRAAAERLQKLHNGDGTDRELDDYCTNTDQASKDERAVVAAYLADHPADDAEPATVEWLRSIGLTTPPAESDAGSAVMSAEAHGVRLWVWEDWSYTVASMREMKMGDFGSDSHHRLTTRGHVRRLLAALGIESGGGISA